MVSRTADAITVANPRTEELYRDHAKWLLRTLRRRFGGEVAEDLVQDTYARLARSHSSEIASPRAFLLTVARNAFVERYNRDRRRREAEQVQFALFGRTEAASQLETVALREIVLRMPVKLRDVFLLSRVGGLTNRQIGEQLGIAEDGGDPHDAGARLLRSAAPPLTPPVIRRRCAERAAIQASPARLSFESRDGQARRLTLREARRYCSTG